MKPMRINGKDCIVLSSYKQVSLVQMEEMPKSISAVSSDSLKHIATHKTVEGLAKELGDVDVPKGKELVLSLRETE